MQQNYNTNLWASMEERGGGLNWKRCHWKGEADQISCMLKYWVLKLKGFPGRVCKAVRRLCWCVMTETSDTFPGHVMPAVECSDASIAGGQLLPLSKVARHQKVRKISEFWGWGNWNQGSPHREVWKEIWPRMEERWETDIQTVVLVLINKIKWGQDVRRQARCRLAVLVGVGVAGTRLLSWVGTI